MTLLFSPARVALALSFLLALAGPSQAKVVVVDPNEPPVVTLPEDEARKVITLQSATFVPLLTDVSPDDAVIATVLPDQGPGLLDINTRAFTPLPTAMLEIEPVSEVRWRDAQTLVLLAIDHTGEIALFAIDRSTGAVKRTALDFGGGFPISLSPNGRKVLVVSRPGAPAAGKAAARAKASTFFDLKLPRPGFRRPGPAVFDADNLRSDAVASNALRLSVLDVASGTQQVLLDTLPLTNLSNLAWSPDETKLALVRLQFMDFGRGGQVGLDSLSTQDGLGNLPPEKNPFLTGNAVDLFVLPPTGPAQHRALAHPRWLTKKTPPIVAAVTFSPDGRTVMAKLLSPGSPRGRRFPTYGQPNRSSYAFINVRTAQVDLLDRTEISAPQSSVPAFVSNDEVLVNSVFGPSSGLFLYNLRSRQLRALAAPEGTIYAARPTRTSREIVFNHGSFASPYEIHKVALNGTASTALTDVNAAIAAINQVRVDKVSFDLGAGVQRRGYLVQPAGAHFPPRNAPIVVWQQGGPTAPMTNDWGANVEAPFALLPNFGIGVLLVPLPGREGFGPEFLDGLADDKNFGQVDIDEQAAIVKQMFANGYTSPDRLGITGCSYGGYFSAQSITRHPELYAAANPQCSLLDLVDEWELGFKPYVSYLEGRTPLDERPEYEGDSPSFNASRVRTPTLIFAGEFDFLPYILSEQFHDAINAAGTPADFYRFKNEGHGLRIPQNQFVAAQAQLAWFRQYLK